MKKNHPVLAAGTRILIVRLSAIGDVMHATAVVHNLKRLQPGCHITWLVSPPAASLLAGNPDIDALLVWDRRALDRAFAAKDLRGIVRSLAAARKLLRPHAFDIALDIQGLFLSGLLTRMSGAPRRIGIHERHEGNFLFMTELAPDLKAKHKIHRYLSALQPLGFDFSAFQPGLVLPLAAAQRTWAKDFWQAQGVETGNPRRPLLLVNTRTTWPDKNWPAENFGHCLRALGPHIQIVFTGAAADAPCIAKAQQMLGRPSLSIAGKTTLSELAALFAEADLLLTGDTGPLYIAEAVGLPTLSLWGPTHPDIYGPLTSGHHFVLSPHSCTACCKTKCRHHTNACMNAITPESVTEKIKRLLQ